MESGLSEQGLLEVESLACERDDRRLFHDLSFRAAAGELWQVAGPNGAGKSTLLRILAGLYGFHEGHFRWHLPEPASAGLLFLGHRNGLRDELTALENLRWLCALHDQPVHGLEVALDLVGMAGYGDVPLAQMSAGQQRRVALARLWLPGKPVWVLDEPFTALDAGGVLLLEGRLREHVAAGGLVLYSSHHRLADDVHQVLLGDGAGQVSQ